jgi:hypothetical protein
MDLVNLDQHNYTNKLHFFLKQRPNIPSMQNMTELMLRALIGVKGYCNPLKPNVYKSTALTFTNSTFYLQSVFMCFVDFRTNSYYFPKQH